MKQQKTAEQIVNEVLEHVTTQGRATQGLSNLGNPVCSYFTNEGKTCGHGFALKPTKRILLANLPKLHNMTARRAIDELGDKIHKPEYRGHSGEFWNDIQQLHDNERNWDKNGVITHDGECKAKEIIEEYTPIKVK